MPSLNKMPSLSFLTPGRQNRNEASSPPRAATTPANLSSSVNPSLQATGEMAPPLKKKPSFIEGKLRSQLNPALLESANPSPSASSSKDSGKKGLSLRKSMSRLGIRNLFDRDKSKAPKKELPQPPYKLSHHPDAEMDLHGITNPADLPIKRLETKEDIMAAIEEIEASLPEWELKADKDASDAEKAAADEIDSKDWHKPQRTNRQRWDDRLAQTKSVLSDMKGTDFSRNHAFVYYVDKKPAGILTFTIPRNVFTTPANTGLYLHNLVTHPGVAACAGELIAPLIAESESDRHKQKGKIHVIAENKDSIEAYERLGFVDTSGKRDPNVKSADMILDPYASDKWQKHDDRWHLQEFMDEKRIG